jgi:hypothetical protein
MIVPADISSLVVRKLDLEVEVITFKGGNECVTRRPLALML